MLKLNNLRIVKYKSFVKETDFLEKVWDLFEKEYPNGSHNIDNFDDYKQKVNKNADIIAACDDDKIVGFVAFYANNKESKFTYVTQLLVSSDYRNFGIGKLLMTEYEKVSKELGYTRLKLEVSVLNKAAYKLYLSMGFEAENVDNDADELNNNAKSKSLYMVKCLD